MVSTAHRRSPLTMTLHVGLQQNGCQSDSTGLTVTSIGFPAMGWSPGQVIVEVLTQLTVEPLGVVGTLTLAVDLVQRTHKQLYCITDA